jgi:iron complex outermembrane receptor protein
MLHLDGGAELQQGFTSVSIYKNSGGNADTLRTNDEINNRQQLVFAQVSVDLRRWTIISGASLNTLRVRLQRFSPATLGKQNRNFNNQLAPRLTIMRKLHSLNIYTSVAKGFSPPTTAELLPTGGAVNLGLNAEKGTDYELGLKGVFFKDLYVDVNAFLFSLKNTIVLRRNALGSDSYINSGSTKQHGIESFFSYPIFSSSAKIKNGLVWLSHTWHNFHYKEFKQLNNDFSGNRLPSVAPHTIASGIDLSMKNGLRAAVTYYYSDKIALDDANSAYAKAYHLLGAKIGYQNSVKKKLEYKIVVGAENLLDQKYSLGNDINGFGGRYYNAAALRNFFVSISLQFFTKNVQAISQ